MGRFTHFRPNRTIATVLPDGSAQPQPKACKRGSPLEVSAIDSEHLTAERTTSVKFPAQAEPIGNWDVTVRPFHDVPPEMLVRWEGIRQCDRQFPQPFFSPRFSAAVHQAREDVFVAIINHDGSGVANGPIGFLPFHRVGRLGVPVGRFLNDAQNVIGLSSVQVDWKRLMRACGVVAFDLHAIVNPAKSWVDTYRLQSVRSYQADLSGDSPGFLRQLEKSHRTIGKQAQKTRKLDREIGPVQLEVDCRCPDILAQMIRWKREQYQRTHILDLFLPDWTRCLLDVLHDADGYAPAGSETMLDQEPLRGLLSVLWSGDQVVAAHYGMVEQGRLHYWFPTYDPLFSRYSPGTALFTELVRHATDHGLDCIDMGYGEQPYKQKQTATTSTVAYGTITDSHWHRITHSLGSSLTRWVKRMPMKEKIKKAWRTIHPTAGIKKLG